MEGNTIRPAILLICCEGKKTEPQYFDIVSGFLRVRGRIKVKIMKNKGQHFTLIDEAVTMRNELAKKIPIDSIEAWAVCDKDEMNCTIDELEKYAKDKNVRLAFSAPKFEIFLLQHFKHSTTQLTGKALDDHLDAQMKKKGIKSGYDKTNLGVFRDFIDTEPLTLERAVERCQKIRAKSEEPYTTAHELLSRLLELAPTP